MTHRRVLIHIVTFNSEASIARCIEHAVNQEGFTLGVDLFIRVTDNSSTDSTVSILESRVAPGVEMYRNSENLGFCGAHNQGAAHCINAGFDAMLVLNPDVGLSPTCLREMCAALSDADRLGLVTPKLVRAAVDLSPLTPRVVDAAGMILTPSLRHFDRGSGELDTGAFDTSEEVFGATGACLLISRVCMQALAIPRTISDESVWRIYPQLRAGARERLQLFDEAFFAYREDADLSWRAQRLRWRCLYLPSACATHVRVVTPERRAQLPELLNRLSVRNRFLLQLNNWSLSHGLASLCGGVVARNLVVVAGVLLRERASLPALSEVMSLAPRARSIYRVTQP